MIGKLIRKDNQWLIKYKGVRYRGGTPGLLGSYSKTFEYVELPILIDDVRRLKEGRDYHFDIIHVNGKNEQVEWLDLSIDRSDCKKVARIKVENDWEEILFDFIDEYPCILPNELFEWLEKNYEIPRKK